MFSSSFVRAGLSLARQLTAVVWRQFIVGGASALTGLRSYWMGNGPVALPTVYFANHSSHVDFVLLWASLPSDIRSLTRPVAGADYWNKSRLRQFVGGEVFNALMIRRQPDPGELPQADPVEDMIAALRAGDSLILFPEGTRNTTDAVLLPFKSGLFRISQALEQVRLVPVWIENLQRVMPKGALLPVPLSCSVRFGPPLDIRPRENKADFLERARQALLDLRPPHDRERGGQA